MQNQTPKQKISIKINDEVLKGVYSNLLFISHTKEEFVLDFINVNPPSGIVNSRVIISPQHAKRVLKALQENVTKYEQEHGNIEIASVPEKEIGFDYKGQA